MTTAVLRSDPPGKESEGAPEEAVFTVLNVPTCSIAAGSDFTSPPKG